MAEPDRETGEEKAEVKVTDRRLFTPDGQLRSDVSPADEEPDTPAEVPSAGARFERRPVEEPRGVDFTMLINAMAEPALLFLGEISYHGAGEPSVDLDRARFQIDMLDLLRTNCRGNLSPDEESLLDRILYQLRMLYVAKANQPLKR
jgi:hypothetical protein